MMVHDENVNLFFIFISNSSKIRSAGLLCKMRSNYISEKKKIIKNRVAFNIDVN